MKKIIVTLNYNNWEEKELEVDKSLTKAQINTLVNNKYGKLDVHFWIEADEEDVSVEEESDFF